MKTEEVTEKETSTECQLCKGIVVDVTFKRGETTIPGSRCCRDCGTIISGATRPSGMAPFFFL